MTTTSPVKQFQLTKDLEERRPEPDWKFYTLFEGDLVVQQDDGTWMKVAPGLAVGGFILSDEDVATLKPADDVRWTLGGTL